MVVVVTGQTASYDADRAYPIDDGGLEKGMAMPIPRLLDLGDGTVRDQLTGLVWLRDADCLGLVSWSEALSAARDRREPACGIGSIVPMKLGATAREIRASRSQNPLPLYSKSRPQ